MKTSWDDERVHKWLTKPLCVRYVAGAFRCATVRVASEVGQLNFAIYWGIGHLKDGEFEVLGAWPHDDECSMPWSLMSELESRGILRLRTMTGRLLGPASTAYAKRQLAKVRNAQVMAFEGQALSKCTEMQALHPSIAEMVLACDRLADEIHGRLTATLKRHRSFANRSEALRFIVAALDRADRRLWSLPAARPALAMSSGQGVSATLH